MKVTGKECLFFLPRIHIPSQFFWSNCIIFLLHFSFLLPPPQSSPLSLLLSLLSLALPLCLLSASDPSLLGVWPGSPGDSLDHGALAPPDAVASQEFLICCASERKNTCPGFIFGSQSKGPRGIHSRDTMMY